MTHRILVTGACGFIGHHVVQTLEAQGYDVVALDRIDGTSALSRLKDIGFVGSFVWHDLRSQINEVVSAQVGDVDAIIHLAASTHVDRSIRNSMGFVLDNVIGTVNLLEFARTRNLHLFLYFSTDEVFGPAHPRVKFSEWDRYNSGNPYAATKASAEELCLSYHNTYKVPVFITHCMNAFGERQHPEKFIPMVVRSLLKGETVKIHADRTATVPGSRGYVYAGTIGRLIERVLRDSYAGTLSHGDKLNIPGEREVDNLSMAQMIAKIADRPLHFEMVDFHSTRPGHDLRYALDGVRFELLQIESERFDETMQRTVSWYIDHPEWLLL